jgi:TetR/AcrR family transcriptional regulator, transcriptional repressor for nem operon
MRVTKEKAAENRERILRAAAVLFREKGFEGVGVDALAAAACLSHGGVYSHFGSKETLAAEAVACALDQSIPRWSGQADGEASLAAMVERYLSRAHRDNPADGCAIAALGAEGARQGETVRAAFSGGVRRMLDALTRAVPGGDAAARENAATAVLATMVGALILSRAVDDPALSDRILRAARTHLLRDAPAEEVSVVTRA